MGHYRSKYNISKVGGFLALVALVGLVVGGGIYSRDKQYWGREPYRLGVYEGRGEEARLSVVSYYPQDKTVEVFVIDDGDKLTAAKNYGQFSARKLYELDKLEQAQGEIIRETLTNNFGLYVREVLMIDKKKGELGQINSVWVKNLLIKTLWQNRGNLAVMLDGLRVWGNFLDFNPRRLQITDLSERNVWEQPGQGTDENIRVFNPLLFDRMVNVHETKLPEEVGIIVVNMTDRSGLALTLSRVLEREGFTVVRIESNHGLIKEGEGSVIEINGVDDKAEIVERLKLITGIKQIRRGEKDERVKATIYLGWNQP